MVDSLQKIKFYKSKLCNESKRQRSYISLHIRARHYALSKNILKKFWSFPVVPFGLSQRSYTRKLSDFYFQSLKYVNESYECPRSPSK